MNEKLPILNVHMLGDFSVMYGDQPISFGKNTTTKAMKLLQILLYHGEQGISREKLLNALYVREELADAFCVLYCRCGKSGFSDSVSKG